MIRKLFSTAKECSLALLFFFLATGVPVHAQTESVFAGLSTNTDILSGSYLLGAHLNKPLNQRGELRAGFGYHWSDFDVSDHELYTGHGPFLRTGIGFQLIHPDRRIYSSLRIRSCIDLLTGVMSHTSTYTFPGVVYGDFQRDYTETRFSVREVIALPIMYVFPNEWYVEIAPNYSPSLHLTHNADEKIKYRTSPGYGTSGQPFKLFIQVGKKIR